jgi:hypothetical protein
MGLGRIMERLGEGLHAFLVHGPLVGARSEAAAVHASVVLDDPRDLPGRVRRAFPRLLSLPAVNDGRSPELSKSR